MSSLGSVVTEPHFSRARLKAVSPSSALRGLTEPLAAVCGLGHLQEAVSGFRGGPGRRLCPREGSERPSQMRSEAAPFLCPRGTLCGRRAQMWMVGEPRSPL